MTSFKKEIESLGKGIGNESRYKIIHYLIRGERTVSEIVEAVKISQPAVSQHLKTLKACNLVSDQRKGQEVFYSINTAHTIELLKELLEQISKCPTNK